MSIDPPIGISAFMIGALMVAGSVSATEIRCPGSVSERPAVAATDGEWIVVALPGERKVEHAGVYLDIAGEFSAQAPDSTKTLRGKEEQVTWRLMASEAEAFAVGCSYTGTTAMLFKKLDRDVAQCVVTYTLLSTGRRQHLKSVNCQ